MRGRQGTNPYEGITQEVARSSKLPFDELSEGSPRGAGVPDASREFDAFNLRMSDRTNGWFIAPFVVSADWLSILDEIETCRTTPPHSIFWCKSHMRGVSQDDREYRRHCG